MTRGGERLSQTQRRKLDALNIDGSTHFTFGKEVRVEDEKRRKLEREQLREEAKGAHLFSLDGLPVRNASDGLPHVSQSSL